MGSTRVYLTGVRGFVNRPYIILNWCASCKAIAPIVEELAEEYAGKVKFVKIDIDKDSALAAEYKVSAIPTLLLLKGDELISPVGVGMTSKSDIRKAIDGVIASGNVQ